jgi:dienelactone hydrolase
VNKIFIVLVVVFLAMVSSLVYMAKPSTETTPQTSLVVKVKPLAKYSYPALRNTVFSGSEITIEKTVKDEEQFSSYIFFFTVQGKKVGGLMNVPKNPGSFPVIIMLRGYVPSEIYEPGVGTSRGGEVLAQNGFITLAPDFFGYGSSDNPPISSLEDRFLTYVTVLELIQSVPNLNTALEGESISARYEGSGLGIWGHSNGGQIALSALEISGQPYPTVLWAPVTKPFPYSVLYYTDDIDDHGKALRKVIADFEVDHDAEEYSLTNYLDWIQAPIQVHQGGGDEAVPQLWSDAFVATMKTKENDIDYYTYPGDDHNFTQGNWGTVIQRTMEFYSKEFKSDI